MVVLSDFERTKKYLNKKEILYRPDTWMFKQTTFTGVGVMNGQKWQDNRRFCLHGLRDVGFGKTSMQDTIREESGYLVENILATKGQPIDFEEFIYPTVSNNITTLVFGTRYAYDDPRRHYLDEHMKHFNHLLHKSYIIGYLPPWLQRIATLFPSMRDGAIKEASEKLSSFIRERIREHKETLEPSYNRDFIDFYLKRVIETQDQADSNFKEIYLIGNIFSFFTAGSSTVALVLVKHMLNLSMKADTLQARLQKEIDDVVGRERAPTWEDRLRMPFTMAVIWEMHRWSPAGSLSAPRAAAEDTYIDDYFVPQGSVVTSNVWAIHRDPKDWKNPDQFDPSRFLTPDGTQLINKTEILIPFSIGRRDCPGDVMASVSIFLLLTSLMQKFRVRLQEGQSFDFPFHGITPLAVKGFRFCFTPR
ncbi:unnamed protein product [Ixodes persulcatus]